MSNASSDPVNEQPEEVPEDCTAAVPSADAGGATERGEELLYHEKQTAALCGVHAINTGPYFSEFDLAHMAQELDAAERALLAEAGLDSVDFLQHVGGESANVRDDGMFSIQVLAKALEVWGLQAVPLTSPDAAAVRMEPLLGEAFVANLQEHWFTIRRMGEQQYWNFNSLYPGPEPLSSFHLSAYLATLQQQGYTIFWIRGALPPTPHPDARADARGGAGQWWTPAEARAAQRQGQELKQQGFLQAAYKGVLGMASADGSTIALRPAGSKRTRGGFGDSSSSDEGEDPALARALAESLWEAGAGGGAPGGASAGGGEDADLAAAIAASLAEHHGGGAGGTAEARGGGSGGGAAPLPQDEEEDPELAAAIAASLAHAPAQQQQQQQAEVAAGAALGPEPALPTLGEEPQAGAGVIELGLRLPDGRRASRRFASWHSLDHVAAFAAAQGVPMARHRLATVFPQTVLEDLSQTLAAAGLEDRDLLVVLPM